MKITIVGLGVKAFDVSSRGYEVIKNAKDTGAVLVFKTVNHDAAKGLGIAPDFTFDGLYEESKDFTALDKRILKTLTGFAKTTPVVYCVPGSATSDNSVVLVSSKHKDTECLPAAGPENYAPAALSKTVLSAYDAINIVNIDTDRLVVITEIDNGRLAGDVKLALSKFYADGQAVYLYTGGRFKKIMLFELDRAKAYSHLTTAYILPEQKTENKLRYGFFDTVNIMKRLRSPGGCAWDREQTHESIRSNMIEEAYEVVDAIDSKDSENMAEELGDIILQSIFHSEMEGEQGGYDIYDVLDRLGKKLVSRHPHVFGTDKASNQTAALSSWENAKHKEKKHTTLSGELEGITPALPQLLRAVKVSKKCVKAGIGADADEEFLRELISDYAEKIAEKSPEMDLEKTLGNLLYSAAMLARLNGLDPELCLKSVIDGNIALVKGAEKILGKSLSEAKPEEAQSAVASFILFGEKGKE